MDDEERKEATSVHSEAPQQLSDEVPERSFTFVNASGPRSCYSQGAAGGWRGQDSFKFWMTFEQVSADLQTLLFFFLWVASEVVRNLFRVET